MRLLIAIAFAGILASQAGRAASMRAAAGQVDITPEPGAPMWGFAARNGPSTGALDPLMARVLVLEAGSTRVAIVTLDLGRTFGEAAIAQVREHVQRSSGVSYVFMAASHTHSGPVILDEYEEKPVWETGALAKIEKAIADGANHLTDATLGAGYGIAYVGHNRLKLNRGDHSVTWFDRNPEKVPTSPMDPTVAVLRVDGADGKPIAILANYACHPVVLGADNREYSADFPGAMAKTVQDALGSNVVAMFLQGGDGDINPYYAVTPLQEDAVRWKNWTGDELGKEVVRVAKTIRTTPADASLQYVEDPINFKLRWDPAKFREGMAAIFGKDFEKQFGPPVRGRMDLPVATILINKEIAIIGLAGEPFVDLQSDWRSRNPLRKTFFVGYANGYHGYFPTIDQTTYGGYGTASVTTWVEPGAGERMVQHSLIQLYTLLGQLTNVPYQAPY